MSLRKLAKKKSSLKFEIWHYYIPKYIKLLSLPICKVSETVKSYPKDGKSSRKNYSFAKITPREIQYFWARESKSSRKCNVKSFNREILLGCSVTVVVCLILVEQHLLYKKNVLTDYVIF